MEIKKILIMLLLLLSTIGCNGKDSKEEYVKREKVKKEIIEGLPEQIKYIQSFDKIPYVEDKFYFIYGLDYEKDVSTNIRYRGVIYSDRLKEYGYPEGLEVGLSKLSSDEAVIYNIAGNYLGLLMQIEIDSIAEKKAIELFGAKTNLYNDWSMNLDKYNYIKERLGKENLSYEEKNGAYSTVVNVFCDDLGKIDEELYIENTYKLAKYIDEYMNYGTALQIYVRDNSYFKNYKLVYYSIYKPFRDREDIKKILEKVKKQEEISEEEKAKLVRVFRKGSLDYRIEKYIVFRQRFKEKEEFPIEKIGQEIEKHVGMKK